MNKTQLAVLKQTLKSAQTRAASVAQEGEKLWLHTYIIPQLAALIGHEAGTVSEYELRDTVPNELISIQSKR